MSEIIYLPKQMEPYEEQHCLLANFGTPVALMIAVLVLPGPAMTLPGNSQDYFILACGLMSDGERHLCSPDGINPKNSDVCGWSSLCFSDLVLADKAVFLEHFLLLL